MGNIHWMEPDGSVRTELATKEPTLDAMKEFVGGWIEHVAVMYEGKYPTSMIVNEDGIRLGLPVNEAATRIYWAASAARGYDLAKEEDRKALDAEWAARMGVPAEAVMNLGPGGPPYIYGNAILLENIRMT